MSFLSVRSSTPTRRTAAHRAPRRAAQSPRRASLRRAGSYVASVLSLIGLVAGGLVFAPAALAAPLMDGTISVTKTVQGESNVPVYQPGTTFFYELAVTCSVTQAGACLDATVTDSVPAPLVVKNVTLPNTPSKDYINSTVGNDVAIQFVQKSQDGDVGLLHGTTDLQILIEVLIPASVTGDDAGVIPNTAEAKALNAPDVSDSADITLAVTETLAVEASKTVKPTTTIPAAPGLPVDFTIGGANTSNHSVDSLTLTDPAAGSNNLGYLDFAGITSITPPTGADRVLFEWQDAGGQWHAVGSAGPIPSDPNTLLDGLDLTSIHGTRFTFSSSTGKLPITPAAGHAAIELNYLTNDAVKQLPSNEPAVITNVVDATVSNNEETASKQAPATVTVLNTPPNVEVEKSFGRTAILPGEKTTATLRATNTGKPVTTLTIAEPGAGGLTLAEQGLTFDGFVADDVEWPNGATSAEITYLYADGSSSSILRTETRDAFPAPEAGKAVVGFDLTFTGEIMPQDYAVVPFAVTAVPLEGAVDVTSTNTVDSTVTDADGQSDDDAATADLTRQAKRVNTTIEKSIAKNELWATPGSNSLVSIKAAVAPNDGTESGSTIGAEKLVVSDPAGPANPPAPSEFWNNFDLQTITAVDVPSSATMTPEYFDGTEWKTLPGVDAPIGAGTSGWNYTPSPELREKLQGIRFTFEPAEEGALLEPGFNVLPYFSVTLRDQLRDGSGSTHDSTENVTIDNVASSTVSNDSAIPPIIVTATDDDSIVLKPINGGEGTGPAGPVITKEWIDPASVVAQSDGKRTARLTWGTNDLPLDTVTISDPATSGELTAVTSSVYDAFNVTRIQAMNDTFIAFDQLVIERYSADAGAWVELRGDVCTSDAPCIGGFGGYDFNTAEQLDTLGVRFTFTESADRADAITNPLTDPAVGSGVASSGLERPIELVMQLRETLRSDANAPVLGTTHPYGYNTGVAGIVNNTVNATGTRGTDTFTSVDNDEITILDSPLNVSLTKRFVDYNADLATWAEQADVEVVGIPVTGTDQSKYPIVTALLGARNDTQSKVNGLTVSDPNANPSDGIAETFPEDFNLYRIVSITQPTGATATTVTLRHAGGGSIDYTIDEAKKLTPAELSDVVGITVAHDGRIIAGGTSDLRLEYQLRAKHRSTAAPMTLTTAPLLNTARAELTSPGGNLDEGNTPIAEASDDMRIVAPTFGVTTTKGITPAERYEDEARTGYTVSVTGKPSGTVRTTGMRLDDATPTFWNAYDFAGFTDIVLPRPVEQVRVSLLLGTSSELASDGTLAVSCENNSDLTGCWTPGAWVTPLTGTTATVDQLTASFSGPIDASDVRGIRFEFQRNDAANWERPSNPTVSASYSVTRRTTLIVGADGGADTLAPTTRPHVAAAPGEALNGHTSNTLVTTAQGAWNKGGELWSATASDTDETVLMHRVNAISVTKTHGRESRDAPDTVFGTFMPGQIVPYSITVTNTGDWAMTGLELVDQVTADSDGSLLAEPDYDVEPGETAPSPYVFTLHNKGGSALDATGFAAELDTANGQLTLGVPAGFVFNSGDVLGITANLVVRPKPSVSPGTLVTNGISVSSDRNFESCAFTLNGTWRDDTSDVGVCESETTFTPAASSPLKVTKSVKGVGAGLGDRDDLGVLALRVPAASCESPNAGEDYYTTPCVPITEPGGHERWRMQLSNSGNIPATQIASIDVFPALGDEGVTVPGPRGSLWAPTFLGDVQANLSGLRDADLATVSLYYSTETPAQSCNAADIIASSGTLASSDPCFADATEVRPSSLWQAYSNDLDPEVLASAKAIKVVVSFADGGALQPGESLEFSYLSQTAWYAEQAEQRSQGVDPIAWNVVAAGSVGNNNGTPVQSTVTQPRRVGVAMASGELAFSKLVEGVKSGWGNGFPTGYPFQLSCLSGEQPVPLVGIDGVTDLSRFMLAADGTVQGYNDGGDGRYGNVTLPLNAECSIAEDPAAPGVDVSYSQTSVAALKSVYGPNVANPAFTGTRAVSQITATNSYQEAGFVVTKSVDNGGAVDHDGGAIAYVGPFGFTAACTFLGSTVLNESFSLATGGEKEFTGLPAGADCTVTESNRALAASVGSTLTQDGVAATPATGATSTFTLTADSEGESTSSLAFTNVFAVGAVSVTKEFAGNGTDAWGNESFEVGMRCELPGATPSVVFDGTHTLSKASPSWNVPKVASGASCTVTELGTGGANQSVVSPANFVVGTDAASPALVTVTNTFTTGSVRVTKALAGEPAASLAGALDGEYTVALQCTRSVDGEAEPIAIPGGAERVITGDGFADYTGLPTGAECTVSETDKGLAQTSSLSPADGAVTIGQNESVEVVVTNTFANGSLAVTKAVTGGASTFAPSSFDATVSCTWQGAEVPLENDGAITLTAGQTTTVDGIPLGSVCELDEADAGQTSWTATPASVTITDGSGSDGTDAVAAIAVENVYESASLRVQKSVNVGDSGATVPTAFQFDAVCTFGGETVLDESFALNADESREFTGLPARAECEVTETDARGASSTVTSVAIADASDAPNIDQDARSVQIPELTPGESSGDEAENVVSFTNYFSASGLVISKALEGAASGLALDRSFEIAVSCTLEGEQPWASTVTLNAANGWTADLGNFIEGTECTVTELGLQGADAVVITPNNGDDLTVGVVTIPDAGVATATVSNWYLTGSLEVTKALSGAAAEKFGTVDFTVELVCTLNDEPVEIADGGERIVSAEAPTTLYETLPSGASCVLSETDNGGAGASSILDAEGSALADAADGYAFTVQTDGTVLGTDDQVQPALTVQNVFNFASVAATKTVDTKVRDAAGNAFDHGSFTLTLSCTLDGREVTALEPSEQLVTHGETVTWTELPEGAECELVESDARGAQSTTITAGEGDLEGEPVLGRTVVLGPLVADVVTEVGGEGESGEGEETTKVGTSNTVSIVNEFAAIPPALSSTGANALLPLGLSALALMLGGLLFAFTRRRQGGAHRA